MEVPKSIFKDLLEGTYLTKTIAQEWRNTYKTDSSKCCSSFYRLIFSCANIDFKNSASDSLFLLEAKQDIEVEEADLPILENKKFCTNLEHFIGHCFKNKSDGILVDEVFWDNMTTILNKLILSKVKVHRWTGVVFSLSILNALATIFLQQFDYASDDEDELVDSLLENIKATFDALFEASFHFAYRDCEAGTQKKCILQLKDWISKFPETFITTYYLRYVSWSAVLPNKLVRIVCLKTMKIILDYTRSDCVEMFAKRVCPIINSQLSSGFSDEVTIATECLNIINMKYPSLADQIHYYTLNLNIFHKNQNVATVTANFILQNLRKTSGAESLSILLLRFAEKILTYDSSVSSEDSFLYSYEFHEQLLVFVDSFFYDVSEEIFDMTEFVHIFEREDETQSFKYFTSSFMKAVARRAFINQPVPFRNINKEVEAMETTGGGQLAAEITEKLLESLGPLIVVFQENKAILENLLGICQFLYCGEDTSFDNTDLENLIKGIASAFKCASEPSENEFCVKALHTLHQKCVSDTNKEFFQVKIDGVIHGYADQFHELFENIETKIAQGSIPYFEDLTLVMKKLTYLEPHFEVPLLTFQGCELFVTYLYKVLSSSRDVMAEITVWFEVIELSLEIMYNHVRRILNKDTDLFAADEIHCVAICLKYFPKYMCFRHTSDSTIYFVNSFSISVQLLKQLHEKELYKPSQDNIEKCILYFIRKHMVPFKDDTSTKVTELLWAQVSDMLLSAKSISFQIFFCLFEILVTTAENVFFQRNLLGTIASLFNQKRPVLFEYLMNFLLIKHSTSFDSLEKLKLCSSKMFNWVKLFKVAFAVLATKLDKEALASEFFKFHCLGVEKFVVDRVSPEFLQFLKPALCFLNGRGFLALKSYLNRNVTTTLSTNPHFKAYMQLVVRNTWLK